MTAFFDVFTDMTVCGGPVRHYRGGRRGAPPLLLLHGAMLDTAAGVWRDVAAPLADEFEVHAIDLPRHGGSRPWRGTLDNRFFMTFLEALLDRLELQRVALVGLSMGGGIATSFALEQPQRVSALCAIGPGGLGARRDHQFLTWLFMKTPGALRLTTRYLARSPRAIAASMRTHLVAGADTPGFSSILAEATAEAQRKHRHREPALDDWQVAAYGPRAMRLDLLPHLDRLAVPTLWMRGERDPLVGHREMALAADRAPGSRLVTVSDAGHVVPYDQPEAFASLARAFLTETLNGGRERPGGA
ncbi:alpha/beta fold hydrolase [Pseudoclavibacter helvolus]|uniref:alpha/beta fold hydrolase n=1 Tax=Pseudoclavibacter helvolus TaxID=255205 RepID=UPI003C75379D